MGPLYGPGVGPQRVPQYGPGPQQGHLRPPQGLKRPYSAEVSGNQQVHEGSGILQKPVFSLSSPQAFPGMSPQYGVPGSSMPGSAGGAPAGTAPYSGPNMQYHPGVTGSQHQ